MGKLISLDQVILANDFQPARLAQGPVVIHRFIDNIPAFDLSLVAPDDGENVFAHALQESVAVHGIALVILENPAWRLIVPDQIVADDEHVVLPSKLDVTVGWPEIVMVCSRVNAFKFQHVFRRGAVEMLSNQFHLAIGLVRRPKLLRVDGRADQEIPFEDILERRSIG